MSQKPLSDANNLIECKLEQHLEDAENELHADVLAFFGSLLFGVDGLVRDAIESRGTRRTKLAIILETGGGFIEVVQRIVNVFRRHYDHVQFIIPNYALSAGTVLVMPGDAILMDYFSVLGPIDPQIPKRGGSYLIPALGYLVSCQPSSVGYSR